MKRASTAAEAVEGGIQGRLDDQSGLGGWGEMEKELGLILGLMHTWGNAGNYSGSGRLPCLGREGERAGRYRA